MARKKTVNTIPLESSISLKRIEPLTKAQEEIFKEYEKGQHLLLHGKAGTGKTFITFYLALKDILVRQRYKKMIIVRSARPSLDMGFMPGRLNEKLALYEPPYQDIVANLCESPVAYNKLKNNKNIEFTSTSYLRGVSFDDAIIVLDEAQNCSSIELHTIATRIGDNSRLIALGDIMQKDFMKHEQSGFLEFISILKTMPSVSLIELTSVDVVRSGFCRDYIKALERYTDGKHQHSRTKEEKTFLNGSSQLYSQPSI